MHLHDYFLAMSSVTDPVNAIVITEVGASPNAYEESGWDVDMFVGHTQVDSSPGGLPLTGTYLSLGNSIRFFGQSNRLVLYTIVYAIVEACQEYNSIKLKYSTKTPNRPVCVHTNSFVAQHSLLQMRSKRRSVTG